jgi:predicted HicB family RNase H-like nuclease
MKRSRQVEAVKRDALDKGRMVHIRLDLELHRKLRLVVAAQDTTLQEWIARTLQDAASKAWSEIARKAQQ